MAFTHFLNRSICRLTSENHASRLQAFDAIKTMLVLVSADETEAITRYRWMRDQFDHLTTIRMIRVTNEKKAEPTFTNGIMKVNKHSLNFLGYPVSGLNEILQTERFDLLVNADERNLLLLHVIAAAARAGMRVGSPLGACKHLYPVSIYGQEGTGFYDYMTQCRDYLNALAGKSSQI